MIIYYAHHMWKYNTDEELKELEQIKNTFNGCEIINPNGAVVENGNDEDAMNQCFDFVRQSDIIVFSTLSDGIFGKGVYDEVTLALNIGLKVYLLREGNFLEVNDLGLISEIIVDKTKTNRKYARIIN